MVRSPHEHSAGRVPPTGTTRREPAHPARRQTKKVAVPALNRRSFLQTTAATIGAAAIWSPALAADPIVIGVPYLHGNTSQAELGT